MDFSNLGFNPMLPVPPPPPQNMQFDAQMQMQQLFTAQYLSMLQHPAVSSPFYSSFNPQLFPPFTQPPPMYPMPLHTFAPGPVDQVGQTADCNSTVSNSSTCSVSPTPPTKSSKKPTSSSPYHKHVVNEDTASQLKSWMESHMAYPYPDKNEMKQLMKDTGFSWKQIRCWFTNHRRNLAAELQNQGKPLPWTKKEGPQLRLRPSP